MTYRKWYHDVYVNYDFTYKKIRCTVSRWDSVDGVKYAVEMTRRVLDRYTLIRNGSLKDVFKFIRESASDPNFGYYIDESKVDMEPAYNSSNIHYGSSDDYREYINLLPNGYDEQIKRSRDEASRKALGKWI